MTNHPNRNRVSTPAANPLPGAIRAARAAAGLTQTAAGALVYSSLGAWQQWKAGLRRMHPALWELFNIKTAEMRGKERIT